MEIQVTPPPSTVPIPRKSRRRWYIIGGFLLLLVATPFLFMFANIWMRDRELEQIYAEIDADDPLPGMKQSFAYMRGVLGGMGAPAPRMAQPAK